MITWNNIPENERMILWKNLRNDIQFLNLEQKLTKIANFFSNFPYENRTIDYYTPCNWPLPWEILYYGEFCRSSISILIYYTILVTDPEIPVDLYLIDDGNDVYLVPIINNLYVLNYVLNEVIYLKDIFKKIKILEVYNSMNLKKIR